MARASLETTSTLGWLGPPSSPSSDNWPIPLVVRRDSNLGALETSGDWFSSSPSESLSIPPRASGDVEPYRVVSRRRLRLAHALFAVAFLALIALVAWEVNVYYGGAPFARIASWFNGLSR